MSKVLDSRVLAMVLAGGRGTRLGPLTDSRSKPAVPFGKHHIINFTLSNIINSKIIDHAYVLTQYKQQGILEILASMNFESPAWDKFIRPLPAQQQLGDDWYLGSANAVHQNHSYISSDPAEYVLILAADHINKFDYKKLLEAHIENEADVTVSGMFLSTDEAALNFGVMEVSNGNIINFKEKPVHPKPHPVRTKECIISQGIYIFNKSALLDVLRQDHSDQKSEHDFGKDILPKMIRDGYKVSFYDHGTNHIPGEETSGYWRDVGTIDAYHDEMIRQTHFKPDLDLYNNQWPIILFGDNQPMAKFNGGDDSRMQYLASGGAIITKPKELYHVVVGRRVRIEVGSLLDHSIVFDYASIGTNVVLKNTIIEEGIIIPDNCIIGEDEEADNDRKILITETGIRVVHAGSRL